MEIAKEVKDTKVICKITGEINIDNSHQLRKEFDELIAGGHKQVVIDLSTLDYIDSSGLATLIEMLQRLKKVGGSLTISSINDKIKSIFEITKLGSLFSLRNGEGEH